MDCQNILNDKGCFLAGLCIKKDQVRKVVARLPLILTKFQSERHPWHERGEERQKKGCCTHKLTG